MLRKNYRRLLDKCAELALDPAFLAGSVLMAVAVAMQLTGRSLELLLDFSGILEREGLKSSSLDEIGDLSRLSPEMQLRMKELDLEIEQLRLESERDRLRQSELPSEKG